MPSQLLKLIEWFTIWKKRKSQENKWIFHDTRKFLNQALKASFSEVTIFLEEVTFSNICFTGILSTFSNPNIQFMAVPNCISCLKGIVVMTGRVCCSKTICLYQHQGLRQDQGQELSQSKILYIYIYIYILAYINI